jgi:hypothetical protein
MAVLSEALLHTAGGPEAQLQALAALLGLVRGLAAHAPQLLERVAAQAAVVLLPVLEAAAAAGLDGGGGGGGESERRGFGGGTNDLAGDRGAGEVTLWPVRPPAAQPTPTAGGEALSLAAAVLGEMVVRQHRLVRRAIAAMPPLPELPQLASVNRVLAQVRGCPLEGV